MYYYNSSHVDHLSGVHIAGEKLYLIQGNKPQSLNWEGYGFSMQFPQDTLLPEDSCEVVIHALVGGNFKFPEDTELVSAVFSISLAKKVNKLFHIEIQHCVALSSEREAEQLQFVATDKDDHLQQIFHTVEGGQFFPSQRYGILEQAHFYSRKVSIIKKCALQCTAVEANEGI